MKAVNLIPADQRQGGAGIANRSGGVAYVLAGGVLCIGGLAALYGQAKHEVASKESEAAQLEAQAHATQAEASGLAAYKSFVSLRQQREAAVLELVNSRFDWAHLLTELGAVLPKGTTVSSFNGAVGAASGSAASQSSTAAKGGAVASTTPPGSVPTLTLSGCTPGNGALPVVLTRLRLIDGVKSVELHSDSLQTANGGSGGGAAVAGSTSCPAGSVSYSVALTFEPLPTPPTTAKAVVAGGRPIVPTKAASRPVAVRRPVAAPSRERSAGKEVPR